MYVYKYVYVHDKEEAISENSALKILCNIKMWYTSRPTWPLSSDVS